MPDLNSLTSGSQISILAREAQKKSKQKPVRVLLKEIGQLVQTLKPCFLMSPLSVSTYLDSNTCKFDVVIFDEASQLTTEDCIVDKYWGMTYHLYDYSESLTHYITTGILNQDEFDNETKLLAEEIRIEEETKKKEYNPDAFNNQKPWN